MAFKARISAITCWPAPPPKIDPTGQQRRNRSQNQGRRPARSALRLEDRPLSGEQRPQRTARGGRRAFFPSGEMEKGDSQLSTVGLDQPQARRTTLSTKAKRQVRPGSQDTRWNKQTKRFLDFETGKLEPWKIIRGKFGHPIGNRTHFFHGKLVYNKQGEHYLTTLEPEPEAKKGSDSQTGVVVSPSSFPRAEK